MITNGKITPYQFGVIIFIITTGTTAIVTISPLILTARQDVWITILIQMVFNLGIIYLLTRLARRFPNTTLVQYSEEILGKWLGKVIAFLYLLFFLFLCSWVLRNIGSFVNTVQLSRTPIDAIHITCMIIICYGVKRGIEVIGRTAEVTFPILILLTTLMVIFLISEFDFSKLRPVLEEGMIRPLKGTYSLLGIPSGETFLLLMIFPFLTNLKKGIKGLYFWYTLTFVYTLMVFTTVVLVLGVDEAMHTTYALYETAKLIRIGEFLERLEAIVGGIWITSMFIKLIVVFFILNLGTAQLFRVNNYRIFIFPFMILVLALSIMEPNDTAVSWFAADVYPVYAAIQGILLPIILLFIAKVRKLGAK